MMRSGDASAFLKVVKEMFENEKEKYDAFLDVMGDFKAQRIDTVGTIEKVKELFKEHKDLIVGFNVFLPRKMRITLPWEDEQTSEIEIDEFQHCLDFVFKIKTRFEGNDHVFMSFVNIINMYRAKVKSFNAVYQEVAMLLQGHSDLLQEFTYIVFKN